MVGVGPLVVSNLPWGLVAWRTYLGHCLPPFVPPIQPSIPSRVFPIYLPHYLRFLHAATFRRSCGIHRPDLCSFVHASPPSPCPGLLPGCAPPVTYLASISLPFDSPGTSLDFTTLHAIFAPGSTFWPPSTAGHLFWSWSSPYLRSSCSKYHCYKWDLLPTLNLYGPKSHKL